MASDQVERLRGLARLDWPAEVLAVGSAAAVAAGEGVAAAAGCGAGVLRSCGGGAVNATRPSSARSHAR